MKHLSRRVASRCVAPANVANRQLCTELGARSSELRAAGSKHVACYSVYRAVCWITGFALITSKKSPPLHRFRMHNLSPLVQLWRNFELRIFWLIQVEAQNSKLSIKMYLDCKRYEYDDVCDILYDVLLSALNYGFCIASVAPTFKTCLSLPFSWRGGAGALNKAWLLVTFQSFLVYPVYIGFQQGYIRPMSNLIQSIIHLHSSIYLSRRPSIRLPYYVHFHPSVFFLLSAPLH